MVSLRMRPSALPRLEKCPASGALPGVFGEGGAAADHGNASHALIDTKVRTGEGPAWVLHMLEDVDPAGSVVARTTEVKLTLDGIEGTADYVAFGPGGKTVTIADWKTGRTQVYADTPQLAWYALAAVALNPSVETVRLVIVQMKVSEDLESAEWFIRERTLDVLDVLNERGRIENIHAAWIDAKARHERGEVLDVREGGHCDYCPAWGACPAKTRAISTLIGSVPLNTNITVTRENAGAVYHAIDAMRVLLDDAEKAVKELAKTAPVPLPDGRELWAVEKSRESIDDVDAAVRVVADVLGDGATENLVTVKRSVTKAAIEGVAKRFCAEKRGGTKAAADLVAKVRAVGAFKQASYVAFETKERKAGLS